MDCFRCTKLTTYIFIWISNICAMAMFLLGIVLCLLYFDDMDSHLRPYLCFLGIFIGLLAGFGAYAVSREELGLLIGYAILALLFFIIQIAVAASAFANIEDRDELIRRVRKRLEHIYQNKLHFTELISIMLTQIVHKCCGITGRDGDEVKLNSTRVMGSCCGTTRQYGCHIEDAYKQGCLPYVVGKSVISSQLIGTMNTISGTVHLFSGVLAAVLACMVGMNPSE